MERTEDPGGPPAERSEVDDQPCRPRVLPRYAPWAGLAIGAFLVPRRKLLLALALAAGLAITFSAVSFFYFTQAPSERPVRKWSFTPEALSIYSQPVTVSPNGRHIAYAAGPGAPRLWVRDVDRLEPHELAGTEGAIRPFWSPDSRFIGFAAGGEVN